MKKFSKLIGLIGVLAFTIAGCASGSAKDTKTETVKLGVVGTKNDEWESVKDRLKKKNIDLQLVEFTDYTQPNAALAEKEIDLNAFQHQIFLDNYNKEHGTKLVSIGNTVNAPLGIYANKLKDITKIKDGGEIAIPNDPTNGGRALILLQTVGLIKVDPAKQQLPTVSDITENKRQLKITELDATQTARALQDVDAGYTPDKDAIFLEPVNEKAKPYVNIVVARKEDQENKLYQKVVEEYQQEETKKIIAETSKGANVPAWETFGKK
ncbi:MetQ/NlpA family ABC transporter substrate-binding protein [Enterococcus faecalis]|uniref:MetQ/NlpA family ABC transporter substrate-binding protein n=1 Tax=Enterococcus faecalis TaxID=1351 RepID=UPI0011DCBFC6|nr:MetQ/NlpA family ABC transporter substrate-binding protein [Enterococcus faecalis]TXU59191.1 MetQ/NlpA family ABC transporter substrate-binding protein [Enterococcus faecalis]